VLTTMRVKGLMWCFYLRVLIVVTVKSRVVLGLEAR